MHNHHTRRRKEWPTDAVGLAEQSQLGDIYKVRTCLCASLPGIYVLWHGQALKNVSV
jgi:hypothetical protein